LIGPELRYDTKLAILDDFFYLSAEFAQSKEVVIFLQLVIFTVVQRAYPLSIFDMGLGLVFFTTNAVPTYICTFINILSELLPDSHGGGLVLRAGSAHEDIIADSGMLQESLPGRNYI